MNFIDQILFSGKRAYERQIADQKEIINRLLDDNRALSHLLLQQRIHSETQEYDETPVETNKADAPKGEVVLGWSPPRQRVRDYINGKDPAKNVSMLTENELKHLQTSAQ